MKNEKDSEQAEKDGAQKSRPEPAAASQLHNYNVMLTRLGDLFGDDEEPIPQKSPDARPSWNHRVLRVNPAYLCVLCGERIMSA